jgi:hypothetical protein
MRLSARCIRESAAELGALKSQCAEELETADCVVVLAVSCEPVSVNFPAIREKISEMEAF